jgi:hypothetical protein
MLTDTANSPRAPPPGVIVKIAYIVTSIPVATYRFRQTSNERMSLRRRTSCRNGPLLKRIRSNLAAWV